MSVAAAQSGGARASDDLKKIMAPFNPMFLHSPEIQIAHNYQKFTENGECTDELALKFMKEMLHDFSDLINFAKKGHADKFLHENEHFFEPDYSLWARR